MPDFTYNPEAHVYTLDGFPVPSVTDVLSAAGLTPDWDALRLDPFYLERGKAVHRAIELRLKGELEEGSVEPRIRSRFEAGIRCMDDLGLRPLAVEAPLCDRELWVAGCPDVVALATRDVEEPRIDAGDLVIPDWKSGELPLGWELQVAGYKRLWLRATAVGEEKRIRLLGVSLADGYKIKAVEGPLLAQAERTFEAAVWVHHWKNRR